MGLYGSPDVGNLYTEPKEPKRRKKEGYKPQKNLWVWIVIIIIDILILLLSGITKNDILAVLGLNCIIIAGISIVNLIINLIKKNKISTDIKFIIISILAFFIFAILM